MLLLLRMGNPYLSGCWIDKEVVLMVVVLVEGMTGFRLPPAIARSRSSFSSMKSLRVRFLTFPALLRSPRPTLAFSFCSLVCPLSPFTFTFTPFLQNAPVFTFSLSSTIISSSPSPSRPPVLELTSEYEFEFEFEIKARFIVPVPVSVCEEMEEIVAAKSSFNALTKAVFGCPSPVPELKLEVESIALKVEHKAPFAACSV
jgi:hypothetical protein